MLFESRQKQISRHLIIKRFSRSAVEGFFNRLDLSGPHFSEIRSLGKVLAYQPVGVLHQTLFPRMIRAAEVGLRIRCFGKDRVSVKLFAVIRRNRPNHIFERLQCPNHRPGGVPGFEVGGFADNDEFGFPLHRHQKPAFLVFAHYGVRLEIADAVFGRVTVNGAVMQFDAFLPAKAGQTCSGLYLRVISPAMVCLTASVILRAVLFFFWPRCVAVPVCSSRFR